MVDEEANDKVSPIEVTKTPKKPVPLPRRSLIQTTAPSEKEHELTKVNNDSLTRKKSDNKYFIRGDWKTASEIMQEKSKIMRNEVQKLEKSVRNIITKRRSVHPKSTPKIDSSDHFRSNSLPDDSVFHSISFNSPLMDEVKCNNINSNSESDISSEDGSFYTTSELPPPYPPPGLPDESQYDEVTSVTSSEGRCSYYSPSSDSNSIYEDLSKFRTASRPVRSSKIGESDSDHSEMITNLQDKVTRSDSWSFYDSVEGSDNRYEVIDEIESEGVNEPNEIDCFDTTTTRFENILLTPQVIDLSVDLTLRSEPSPARQGSNTSSVVFQFDPLFEAQPEPAQFDLLTEISKSFPSLVEAGSKEQVDGPLTVEKPPLGITNPFQNPVILGSLSEESSSDEGERADAKVSSLKESGYGKVKKPQRFTVDVRESVRDDLRNYDVELPPSTATPPVPPRRFDSITNVKPSPAPTVPTTATVLPAPTVPTVPANSSREKTPEPAEKAKSSGMTKWSSVKKAARKVAVNIENHAPWNPMPGKKGERAEKGEKKTENTEATALYGNVPKEEVYVPAVQHHSGVLFRPGGVQRWGVLAQRKLTVFVSKDSPDVKETVPMDKVTSLRSVQEAKIT